MEGASPASATTPPKVGGPTGQGEGAAPAQGRTHADQQQTGGHNGRNAGPDDQAGDRQHGQRDQQAGGRVGVGQGGGRPPQPLILQRPGGDPPDDPDPAGGGSQHPDRDHRCGQGVTLTPG